VVVNIAIDWAKLLYHFDLAGKKVIEGKQYNKQIQVTVLDGMTI
jgi:hypothetical protein